MTAQKSQPLHARALEYYDDDANASSARRKAVNPKTEPGCLITSILLTLAIARQPTHARVAYRLGQALCVTGADF